MTETRTALEEFLEGEFAQSVSSELGTDEIPALMWLTGALFAAANGTEIDEISAELEALDLDVDEGDYVGLNR